YWPCAYFFLRMYAGRPAPDCGPSGGCGPGRLPPAATEAPPPAPADRGRGKVLLQRSDKALPPPRWPFAGPAFSGSALVPGGPDRSAAVEFVYRFHGIVSVPGPGRR